MPRQAPSLPFSLLLFVAGAVLVYYVFHSHRADATDMVTVWNGLATGSRLMVVVGFGASGYGVGGILNAVLLAAKRR